MRIGITLRARLSGSSQMRSLILIPRVDLDGEENVTRRRARTGRSELTPPSVPHKPASVHPTGTASTAAAMIALFVGHSATWTLLVVGSWQVTVDIVQPRSILIEMAGVIDFST
jgi:hypothetical protein